MTDNPGNWNIDDAVSLYKLKDWAADYFDVSSSGEIEIVAPGYAKPVRISLMDVVSGMQERGLHMPVMLRIKNILDHRISLLNESFARAIHAADYGNHYRGVFPIKVNQQCQVVEEIAQFGARYHHGLEAGSKAELIIALANLTSNDSFIICNGYKDEEFIDLGLHARNMGIKCFFVVETQAELQIIIRRSTALGVKPLIGVRAKLASEVDGHWSEDSGDRSLFGLSASQLIDVVDALKAAGLLDSLQLLHFHMGSQIPNIRNIRAGVAEAIRYYADLAREGAPMGHLDIGGGLAVDYEGAHNSDVHSKNYSLDEYCSDVIEAVMETLDPLELPHPVILSESGRATVAYSSILMFNILDVTHFEPGPLPDKPPEDYSEQVQRLFEINDMLNIDNIQRCYNNAAHYRDEVRERFRHGELDLRERAVAENIYLNIMQRITRLMPQMERVPQDLESLQEDLADIYYGNFSVFQSLPDTWAIEQIFPVLPIHRLDERPERHAIIADLTCDCDGKIDNFIGGEKTIALHSLKEGEDYYIGVFLVGAYQETLGDLHNLFGDTNIISIQINEDGSFDFIREMHGDSIADVLSYVEYNPGHILEQFRNNAEQAVRRGVISAPTRQKIMEAYSASLRGYTYYETQE
ncbi:MAG: biosynthetic arginine decarboxylase [Gammaproteobacteria bacterium]|nr:biosynthetic arginine decarboxylase [Gammaproteobacteria bacterium]